MSRGVHTPFDDHASIAASLEDFEHQSTTAGDSPQLRFPTRGGDDVSSIADSDSGSPWSPPGWKRHSGLLAGTGGGGSGSGWYRQHTFLQNEVGMGMHGLGSPMGSGSRSGSARQSPSRESSPQYESAPEGGEMVDETVRVLPPAGSGLKNEMVDPYPSGEEFEKKFGEAKEASPPQEVSSENPNNYIRFAVRAEVQHRTEPFEMFFSSIRYQLSRLTRTRLSTFLTVATTIFTSMILSSLFSSPPPPPVPDLVKVASLARAFEPLIFYSENGIAQIGDLQDTGVAVWDLCESVRTTNMTSAPLIVSELDTLAETLKTLSLELTRFFASVDGDVDGILIVMDWAKRELASLSSLPSTPLTTFLTNSHSALATLGLVSSSASSSSLTSLIGHSRQQRVHRTLLRTFREFLSVLEDAIAAELSHSAALFALFEAIDRQFHNLARTVIRESDAQEREEGELLSSLWVRVLGANAATLRKFDKNRRLLRDLRSKTVRNKGVLLEHNGKLLALKANLETLRRKLVSPLVRSNESVILSLEDQVGGLEGTYEYLKGARDKQKAKLMEMVYGAGSRRGREGLPQGLEGIGS